MRVLLDASAGAREDLSGIGRYVHSLCRALSELEDGPQLVLGVRASKRSGRPHLPRLRGRAPDTRLLQDHLDRFLLQGFDLFHGLDARITPVRRVPRMATLHDVFSLQHGDLARDHFRGKKLRRYREIADGATRILCVSEVTRRRYVEAFPQAAPRCVVVHHGVSERFRPPTAEESARIRSEYGLPGPYLLFVGLLSTRKNVTVLIGAFEQIAAEDPDLRLVLAGADSHGHESVRERRDRSPFRDRILTPGYVAAADLPALYGTAEAFVFPTRDEGFGLPILEALACGTPVVASDLEVLREVGGEHPSWAEVGSEVDLARALHEALAASRDEASVTARQGWARRFRWEETARLTWNAYREALTEG